MDLVLLPRPPQPGLFVILGSKFLIPWALQNIVYHFSPLPLFWLDAANRFDAKNIGRLARICGKDPVAVLRSFYFSRPFTAFQLEAMVTQKLEASIVRCKAVFAVIADPIQLYDGAEGRDSQVKQSYDGFLYGLKNVASRYPIAVLLSHDQPPRYYDPLLQAADTITQFLMVDGRPALQPVSRTRPALT